MWQLLLLIFLRPFAMRLFIIPFLCSLDFRVRVDGSPLSVPDKAL